MHTRYNTRVALLGMTTNQNRDFLPKDGIQKLHVQSIDWIGGICLVVKKSHKKEVIQNEEVSEIERFDVMQFDQHLQKHLAHAQTLVKHEWP